MPGGLGRIEALLADRIGLDPAAVGSSLIPRAVRLRTAELGIADWNDYASLVHGSEAELQALIEEVVVPESWFFRDEQPFRLFQDHVRAGWLANPKRAPLRVLSIPCAGGEEPYSLVIALFDIGLPEGRFQVDAVDVSARRLEVARRGVFSRNAFRGTDQDFRARYFRDHPQGFEIDPALPARVRSLQGSILEPGLLAGEICYDVLFCRNLLIYLDLPSRARVMASLDRLLAADGLLIIGHADRLNLTDAEPRFDPVGEPGSFAYRRAPSPIQAQTGKVPHSSSRQKGLPRDAPSSQGRCSAAGSPGDSRSQGDSGFPRGSEPVGSASLLDQAAELANLGRHDAALAVCQEQLRLQGPGAAAFYLMGVIYQAAGNRSRAEECFHKTVYLDPAHDEALLALALSAERRGDSAAAAGFRRRAERAVTRKGAR